MLRTLRTTVGGAARVVWGASARAVPVRLMSEESFVTAKHVVHETDWLRLVKVDYVDHVGKNRTWQAVERVTRNGNIDGVYILPILTKMEGGPHVALVSQFRPPVGGWSLELPAGMLDPSEAPTEAALRELREETGLIASRVLMESKFPLFHDAGLSNSNIQLVTLEVDMSNPFNKTPEPEFDETEFINVHTVPLASLSASLHALQAEHGLAVDAKLFALAYGLELAGLFPQHQQHQQQYQYQQRGAERSGDGAAFGGRPQLEPINPASMEIPPGTAVVVEPYKRAALVRGQTYPLQRLLRAGIPTSRGDIVRGKWNAKLSAWVFPGSFKEDIVRVLGTVPGLVVTEAEPPADSDDV